MRKMKHTLILAATALTFAACIQDESSLTGKIEEFRIPLELTAGGMQAVVTPSTRGTIDGNWENAKTVAVRINGNIKEYTATPNASGNGASLTCVTITDADTDFWWTANDQSKTVDAWYPYSNALPSDWSIDLTQTEQTFINNDLMYARQTLVTLSSHAIQFQHMLAKVVINLVNSDYLKSAEKVKVTLTNQYQTGTFRVYGNYPSFDSKAGDTFDHTIIPYRLPSPNGNYFATYQALVIPLDAAAAMAENKPLISVEVDGTTYSYDLSKNVTGMIFSSGNQYTYNITVQEEGLDVSVSSNSINWTNGAGSSGSVEI